LSPPRRSKRDEELEEEEEEEETVIRDFDGRAVTEQQLVSRRSRLDEKFESLSRMEWGKGLVQQKMAQSRSAERARGASAPLARYIDDKDLNDELRDKQVWGDPMIRLSSSVKSNARNKRSARPMYKGVPFSNRFGILPGYRWDGIDRSNGWEKKRIGLISDRDTYQQFVHVDDE
jgi:pre-mRNA-splicing factor CWC26